MTYTVPHGIHIRQPEEYIPSPRVVAEYEDYDRQFLLYRIEELETDLEALSGELSDEIRRSIRVIEVINAARDIALDLVIKTPPKGEIETANSAKKLSRKGKAS